MKRLLAISLASASVAIGAIPVLAEVDPNLHKMCVEAQDYLGCVKGIIKSIGAASSGVADSRAR